MLVSGDDTLKLERSHLKDQAAQILRDTIISGRITAGTKLTERSIADLLGISRAPARDALMKLERDGLIVSKSDARYVIELTEQDARHLYEVRSTLEKLAVAQATKRITTAEKAKLKDCVTLMKEAFDNNDAVAYIQSDVDMHRLIWDLSGNPFLYKALDSLTGPIFVLVINNAETYDWQETLALHEELAHSIASGHEAQAMASIERHMDNALERALRLFNKSV